MPPHFGVIKLRHRPRNSPRIEANAALHRRHVRSVRHGVYMHYVANIVNCDFTFIILAPAERLKITPSRKARRESKTREAFRYSGVGGPARLDRHAQR